MGANQATSAGSSFSWMGFRNLRNLKGLGSLTWPSRVVKMTIKWARLKKSRSNLSSRLKDRHLSLTTFNLWLKISSWIKTRVTLVKTTIGNSLRTQPSSKFSTTSNRYRPLRSPRFLSSQVRLTTAIYLSWRCSRQVTNPILSRISLVKYNFCPIRPSTWMTLMRTLCQPTPAK